MTVTFIEGIRISKSQLTRTVTGPVQDTELADKGILFSRVPEIVGVGKE
jgi:hypothetical protein